MRIDATSGRPEGYGCYQDGYWTRALPASTALPFAWGGSDIQAVHAHLPAAILVVVTFGFLG